MKGHNGLEETLRFLQENRSNEQHFEKLEQRLEEEINKSEGSYRQQLEELKEKQVPVYKHQREVGGSAWPEFENFVSQFEKAVTEAVKQN